MVCLFTMTPEEFDEVSLLGSLEVALMASLGDQTSLVSCAYLLTKVRPAMSSWIGEPVRSTSYDFGHLWAKATPTKLVRCAGESLTCAAGRLDSPAALRWLARASYHAASCRRPSIASGVWKALDAISARTSSANFS
jgi:hypothetical protein